MKKGCLFLIITLVPGWWVWAIVFSAIPGAVAAETPSRVAQQNIARSERRVLPNDPARDKNLLALTGNDPLTAEIIRDHSLVVGSKMYMVSRRAVYAWLVENIRISAALSRLYGRKYYVSKSSVYEFHGDDGEGMTVDFYTACRDSEMTILVGKGKLQLFFIPITGSFINFTEYRNLDSTRILVQNCMYVKVNNPVARFVTHIVFALSDVERVIMEKIYSLDDTTFQIVKTFMEDPHLYQMLQNPHRPPPGDAAKIAVKMRDAVLGASSPEKAAELGTMIEQARIEVGGPK
jgi:hypothetical protein